MSFIDIIDNTRTDKNTSHSYLSTYEQLLLKKKNTAKNILEIGIQNGGSIKLWHDYFLNASIFGLDTMNEEHLWDEINNKDRITLDCYGDDLKRLYEKKGFRVISRKVEYNSNNSNHEEIINYTMEFIVPEIKRRVRYRTKSANFRQSNIDGSYDNADNFVFVYI
jgi:hypothetical protein